VPPVATTTVGSTVQLTASIQEANRGHGHRLDWTSSDDGIASVDHKGLVKGKAPGLATITASTQGRNGFSLVTVFP
jgi:uncharacterized protein YjdB